MKKLSLLFLLGITITACHETKTSRYFVSANAYSLFDSYRDLVSKTNTGDLVYKSDTVVGTRRLVAAAMPCKGHSGNIEAGYLTYTSYYWKDYQFKINPKQRTLKNITAAFHTCWFAKNQDTALFGGKGLGAIFIPKPVVIDNSQVDNSFHALLVPVEAYQKSALKDADAVDDSTYQDYENSHLLPLALDTKDMKSINDLYMEADGGYMSSHLPARYNSDKSSIGIICDVVNQLGQVIPCYVFNNSEMALPSYRLVWKNLKQ